MQTSIDLNTLSKAELLAQIEALKAAAKSKLTMKVSEKGCLSVYGLGRFPVTLYASQWQRLIDSSSEIGAFIKAHQGQLKSKD